MEFKTQEELRAHIAEQLRGAVPPGWTVEGEGPRWEIRKDHEGGSWDNYQLFLWWAGQESQLVVTHGNSDHGRLLPEHVLLKATVIDLAGLHSFRLDYLLITVLGSNPPNRWGLT